MKRGIVLAFALGCLATGCGIGNPTDGEKIGTLIRVAKSGMVCKTWEATIVRGGLSAGSGGFATQPYDFTITDEATAQRALEFMELQQEVKLTYQAEGIYSICRSDSGGHFAKSLEALSKDR